MEPPSHGPTCYTEDFYRTTCPSCGRPFYFWSCSCGSQVLMMRRNGEWRVHSCQARVAEPRTRELPKCPHGVLKIRKCGACDMEALRKEYGMD